MRWSSYAILVAFIVSVVFFFPKDAGLHGEVTLDEEHSCDCYGFEKTNKLTGAYVYNTYCYGVPHNCRNILQCGDDDTCWHKEQGCKCPDKPYWAPTKVPCEDKDKLCICTHNECDLGPVGG